mmetsp:Transcript_73989/g.217108  ORF Transcript_73989/g.217108 Transcript_73989/m.217108 type:complete len:349 (+) Transcript_73989:1254-2300(+)
MGICNAGPPDQAASLDHQLQYVRQREVRDEHVALPGVHDLLREDGGDQGHKVLVRQHDALRHACGAGGVHDEGQVVRLRRVRRHVLRALLARCDEGLERRDARPGNLRHACCLLSGRESLATGQYCPLTVNRLLRYKALANEHNMAERRDLFDHLLLDCQEVAPINEEHCGLGLVEAVEHGVLAQRGVHRRDGHAELVHRLGGRVPLGGCVCKDCPHTLDARLLLLLHPRQADQPTDRRLNLGANLSICLPFHRPLGPELFLAINPALRDTARPHALFGGELLDAHLEEVHYRGLLVARKALRYHSEVAVVLLVAPGMSVVALVRIVALQLHRVGHLRLHLGVIGRHC